MPTHIVVLTWFVLYVPTPQQRARRAIIDIHTKNWSPPLSVEFKNRLSQLTTGYCGADIKALCAEASLRAVRRRYPQVLLLFDDEMCCDYSVNMVVVNAAC